jgi:hypothetical protein
MCVLYQTINSLSDPLDKDLVQLVRAHPAHVAHQAGHTSSSIIRISRLVKRICNKALLLALQHQAAPKHPAQCSSEIRWFYKT